MMKVLIFIRKNAEDSVLQEVEQVISEKTNSFLKKNIRFANLEGGLLSPEKFYKFAEIQFNSRDEMNRLFQTPEGKEFNKFISNYHNLVSIFFANFEGE